jgi:hypothetical protein
MNIEDKIKNIVDFLTKIGFVELYFGKDEIFTQLVGYGKANYTDFIILQKTISESEKLCCRIEKDELNVGGILGDEQYSNMILYLHDFNILHIKDEMIDYYFFESDLNIQKEYDVIMDELKNKFRHDLRKLKIKNLL